jgi:hypothetical protein
MGSPIIGRLTCPECGFASAHLKQSERCLFRYCPECGSQFHARTERQKTELRAKARELTPVPPEKPAPPATHSPAATEATPATPAPTRPRRTPVFDL